MQYWSVCTKLVKMYKIGQYVLYWSLSIILTSMYFFNYYVMYWSACIVLVRMYGIDQFGTILVGLYCIENLSDYLPTGRRRPEKGTKGV